MKIITKSEMVWDEAKHCYVVIAEESHEYDGPVALAKGGGDGGAKDMRRQEEERKRKINEAMSAVSRVFGGPVTDFVKVDPLASLGPAPVAPVRTRHNLSDADEFSFQQEQERYRDELQRYNQQKQMLLQKPEQFQQVNRGDSPGQFGDDYYKNISDSFMAFQQPLFDEQSQEALRRLPFAFASTDNSDYQRTVAQLQADIERERAQLKDKALDFSNQQRSQIENSRADLVSMAQSGTDASAIASMANARSAALAKPPVFEPISDLFSKYTAMASNAVGAGGFGGQQSQFNQQRPLVFNNNRNNAQRIVA